MPSRPPRSRKTLCCSFCGKSEDEVAHLIAGPKVHICDECVSLCHDIVAEEIDRTPDPGKPFDRLQRLASLFDGIGQVLAANPDTPELAAEARALGKDLGRIGAPRR